MLDENKKLLLETWLVTVANGRRRKNGAPMVDHWLAVGRSLLDRGEDNITICGGYGHDLVEDIEDLSLDNMEAVFEGVIGDRESARIVVQLIHDCSYLPEEYNIERQVATVSGKAEGKAIRKKLACARWISHTDPRVWAVKIADVDSNNADCASVSESFAADYRGWALPLREALLERQSDTVIEKFNPAR